MPHFAEILLADETSVRLELAPVGDAPVVPTTVPGGSDDLPDDLPDGFAGVAPVARGSGAPAVALDTLRAVLRPLGPLLQEVHDAVAATPDRPQEMNVSFGVQIGQDLKLGIVGTNGQASLTVSATWQLPAHDGATASGAR
ncbi:CU044_2847 family protein [Wenjunlia tyrosinilytica]|uniref:Trypsin-co-occurring domain-containing protein n=1 Tax=Wenjunlia tyrosinilytica TaxID=1544741 RepID=A0A917ZRK9_9ACTN|nr:CU044_2847 family protein [Wenjunlia tyrosinilytica]GGO91235.1 hypothetical protein GCM10012280_38610 [Wenjunlia tyrosinilytica]